MLLGLFTLLFYRKCTYYILYLQDFFDVLLGIGDGVCLVSADVHKK